MTVLGVKSYLRQLVTDIDQPVPCTVLIQRPKQITIGTSSAVIFEDERWKETRFTLGRAVGRKRVLHTISCAVYWVVDNEQDGGDQFDHFLNLLSKAFRLTTIPANIYDPLTNEQSTLVFLGEEMEWARLPTELDEEPQGMVVLTALGMLTVEEHVTG